MLDKVRSFMRQNHMMDKGDKVVIGTSGGADSTCLFFVLLELREEWGLDLHAVHVNHGIRGEEADGDEAFTRRMVEREGVAYHCVKEDVGRLAKEKGWGVEEAGRVLRYEAFERLAKSVGGAKIATAHNQNDQAETVLFHLCRGSGLKGLSGIAPVRGDVIRPLLCVSRKEIEAYLLDKGIAYREDSTNLGDGYTRNRIRNKALPLLEEAVNEKAVRHIAEAADALRSVQGYMEKKAQERFLRIVSQEDGLYSYQADVFLKEDVVMQRELIRRILLSCEGGLKDVGAVHIEALRSLAGKEVGKRVELPDGWEGVKGYQSVKIGRRVQGQKADGRNKNGSKKRVTPPCEVEIDGVYRISFEISYNVPKISKNDCTKCLDYDKIKDTIFIRLVEKGDYIVFDAEGRRKKMNRYFIDQKVPRQERGRQWVLAEGNRVIWLVGGRVSEAYRVDANTKRILQIRY